MAEQRNVAGLWCGQVLEGLSDYLDGALSPEQVAAVEAHLAGCPLCARFGVDVQRTLAAVREMAPPEDLPPGVEARLQARLDAALDEDA